MENIIIAATDRAPAVTLDFTNRHFSLCGEAYPEDPAAFWGPIIKALQGYFVAEPTSGLTVDIKLMYFNSSSAKALMNIFSTLDKAGHLGAAISINWHYLEDDDTMQEFGEEFSEDLQSVEFYMRVLTL